MKRSTGALIYAGILLSTSYCTIAQNVGDVSEHISTIVNAKPIERIAPKFPINAARSGQEGWAKVSFVIDKEGNVVDPIIQDSSGLSSFEKETLKAVKKWKYSPAIQDGEAIEQCQMQVQMDFVLDKQKGVTRKFKTRYLDIIDAITNKDVEQAAALLTELGDSQLWNHSESTYYYLADAVYAKAIDNQERELKSVNRALSGSKETLKGNSYLYLIERQFILNLASQQYLNALESIDRLQATEDNEALLTKLQPYAEQVSQLVKSEEPLLMDATIHEGGQFYHKLSRDTFSLAVNQGSLDEVQIRCANKRSRFTVVEGNEWHIPKAWGQCTIFVTGKPETEFKVLELGAYVGEI
jgi:TonB family protein